MAFSRAEILARLRKKIDAGEPIVLGGAGIGLVAKIIDRAGIDIIMAYNTGPFRMDGHGSLAGYLAYGDANAITLDLALRILPVVENTPVIAGIGAADPYAPWTLSFQQSWKRAFRA
jgi:predicted TIM-barrel enzyme